MYNTEINNDNLMFLIIGLPIIFIVIVIIISIIISISNSADSSSRLDTVNTAIEQEIKDFLYQNNDINYFFKNSNLEQQMKSEIQTAIIDLRHNRYTFNKLYLHRSETKIKQIHCIINKYYKLDKRTIIEIDNEIINNPPIQ